MCQTPPLFFMLMTSSTFLECPKLFLRVPQKEPHMSLHSCGPQKMATLLLSSFLAPSGPRPSLPRAWKTSHHWGWPLHTDSKGPETRKSLLNSSNRLWAPQFSHILGRGMMGRTVAFVFCSSFFQPFSSFPPSRGYQADIPTHSNEN